MNTALPVAATILAAGASSRLGEPKQLLQFRGSSLIQRAVAAVAADVGEVIVVLGAHRERISTALGDEPVRIVINQRWRDGASTSLQAGLAAVDDGYAGCVLMTCDQPLVDHEHIERLVAQWRTRPGHCAATGYANTAGVPALIPRSCFGEVNALSGDQGARAILRADRSATTIVPFEGAAFDVDRPSDLQRLREIEATPIDDPSREAEDAAP